MVSLTETDTEFVGRIEYLEVDLAQPAISHGQFFQHFGLPPLGRLRHDPRQCPVDRRSASLHLLDTNMEIDNGFTKAFILRIKTHQEKLQLVGVIAHSSTVPSSILIP